MDKIVFEDYFNQSEGKPFYYNVREIKMSNKVTLCSNEVTLLIEFISTDSDWKQGIVLQTKGKLIVNGKSLANKIVLWEHTAPKQIELTVKTNDKTLFVYNVWDIGDGIIQYGHNGGALFIEQTNQTTIYHCNDGYPDDDFDDLVFKVVCQ